MSSRVSGWGTHKEREWEMKEIKSTMRKKGVKLEKKKVAVDGKKKDK